MYIGFSTLTLGKNIEERITNIDLLTKILREKLSFSKLIFEVNDIIAPPIYSNREKLLNILRIYQNIAKRNNINLGVHLPYTGFDLFSWDDKIVANTIELINLIVDTAPNIKYIVMHEPIDVINGNFINHLSNSILLIENTDRRYLQKIIIENVIDTSIKRFNDIIIILKKRMGILGACYDIGHAKIFIKDIRDPLNGIKYLCKNNVLKCIHANTNNGLLDEHLLPDIKIFVKIKNILNNYHCHNIPIIIEVGKINLEEALGYLEKVISLIRGDGNIEHFH